MSKKAVEHHRSADGEGSNEPANTMPLGNRNGLHTHSRGNVGDGKAINTPGTEWPHLDPVIRPIAAQDNLARAHHILKDLYVSVPFGDGGNPSPSGEGKVRVTWSSATLQTGSAYEERPQGASRVDPQI